MPTIADSGYSVAFRDKIKEILKKLISEKFAATLGQVDDIVNLVAAQIYYESGYKVNARGPVAPVTGRTAGNDYISSTPAQGKLQTGTATERANVEKGLRAWGLGQVMGWNFVRGASLKTGKCEIERLRPDLESILCVNAGEDIQTHITGYENMEKALLAQLVILEGKYKNVTQTPQGFTTRGDVENRLYRTRIEAAFSAYLGLGKSDVNRTNPKLYSQSICYGSTYAFVHGKSFALSESVAQANSSSPGTDGSGSPRLIPPGC